ncbi:Ethanolamine permease [Mycolicibacterium fortuitum]|uniref:Ethanolamine permease n=1 Tax=Mycolicibacterium fortuitum TaxID=1766 RepID=A0A0N9XBB2_MYCFO|nr:Ethanolamine permease [Mycolicibacterium fortuitum]
MAGLPYLAWFVEHVLGKLYAPFGADPAMAATTPIASDMGGYQLAHAAADSTGTWLTASINGFLLGATISFIIQSDWPSSMSAITSTSRWAS